MLSVEGAFGLAWGGQEGKVLRSGWLRRHSSPLELPFGGCPSLRRRFVWPSSFVSWSVLVLRQVRAPSSSSGRPAKNRFGIYAGSATVALGYADVAEAFGM